jgi:hypothetical protein
MGSRCLWAHIVLDLSVGHTSLYILGPLERANLNHWTGQSLDNSVTDWTSRLAWNGATRLVSEWAGRSRQALPCTEAPRRSVEGQDWEQRCNQCFAVKQDVTNIWFQENAWLETVGQQLLQLSIIGKLYILSTSYWKFFLRSSTIS